MPIMLFGAVRDVQSASITWEGKAEFCRKVVLLICTLLPTSFNQFTRSVWTSIQQTSAGIAESPLTFGNPKPNPGTLSSICQRCISLLIHVHEIAFSWFREAIILSISGNSPK